jgi:hypothetical protein
MDHTSAGVLRTRGDYNIAAALCRAHADTPTGPVHAQDDNGVLRAEVGTLLLLVAASIACCLKVDGEGLRS